MNPFYIAALFLFEAVFATSTEDYCQISESHTMCLYQGLGESCGNSSYVLLSNEDKKIILDHHNKYRRIVAKGLAKKDFHQPYAANMRQLEWDEELWTLAQRWADQCLFQHDIIRNSRRFTVGQNIYVLTAYPVRNSSQWATAMKLWFDEIKEFNATSVNSYVFDPKTGHYSQIVWADTQFIGCGQRSYGNNQILVCNYGQAGNYLETPVYKIGPPCSSCPYGTVCRNALCALPGDEPTEPATVDYSGENSTESTTPTEEVGHPTNLPIDLNIIEDFNLDDEEIRNEIEDVKERIRKLLAKIVAKTAQLQQS